MILHGIDKLDQYVELSDWKAKITYGFIEYLDEMYDEFDGTWIFLNPNDSKTFIISLSYFEFFILFFSIN